MRDRECVLRKTRATVTRPCVQEFFAYAAIQLFDGNILAPLLLSGVVNLHPVAIIISVLLFGGLWGVWGVFFAIPLATLVNTVIKTWLLRSEAGETDKTNSG